MTPIVIHHANCWDGIGAAWAAKLALGHVVLIPAQYGGTPPDVTGQDVYIVDFSYPPEVINEMAKTANKIVMLDHHRSALNMYNGNVKTPPNVEIVLDMDRSGCRMAWEYFHKQEIPRILAYIEDRDLWRWNLPSTKFVTAWLTSQPVSVDTLDVAASLDMADLIVEGMAINRYIESQVDHAIQAWKNHQTMVVLDDKTCPALCSASLQSEIGHALCEYFEFSAVFYVVDHDTVQFSLRSTQNGPDVSEIAGVYGGGGHRNAAGFRIPLIDLPGILSDLNSMVKIAEDA